MSKTVSQNRTVSISQAKKAIKRCVEVKRPVFFWGPPGVGKSDSIKQICDDMGGLLIDIRLSLMEPTDLRGMPFYNKDSGKMEWAPPVDLPDEETAAKYPIVFILFDEMNSAAPAVQAACYQISLNRRVGTYKLPDNAVIIAAGNRDGDKGVTYRMPTPLANRFVHLELKVDFNDWEEWAVQERIHKDVLGFLSFSKDSLYDFDPSSPNKSFATPRSWEFVSQLLDDDSDEGTMVNIVAGTVGEGLALKFMAHRKTAGKMPKPTDILHGKVDELKIKEVSAHFSLAISCAYELKDHYDKLNGKPDQKWHEYADNVLGFMMKCFTTEVVVMSMRMMLQTQKLPFDPKKLGNFKEFYEKYGKLILKAASV